MTGPIAFAIDHDDKTAWGIDIGPHRRNEPRKAVFVAEKPVSFPGGTVLTFALSQKHGGWNSDDNQNNNLGRYRLSVTNAPNPTADPLPHNVREILAISPRKAVAGADRGRLQLLADDRPRMERGQRRDRAALAATPGRRVAVRPGRKRDAAPDAHPEAGRFSQAGTDRLAGRSRFPAAASRRAPADAAHLCALADRSPFADDGAGHRQPRLAGLFRHRASSARARTWARSAKRRPIRSCSIGWRSNSWTTAGASSGSTG